MKHIGCELIRCFCFKLVLNNCNFVALQWCFLGVARRDAELPEIGLTLLMSSSVSSMSVAQHRLRQSLQTNCAIHGFVTTLITAPQDTSQYARQMASEIARDGINVPLRPVPHDKTSPVIS